MKKAAAIGNIIFIYLVAMLPVLLMANGKNPLITFMWKRLFSRNIFVPLGILLLFGILMYLINFAFLIKVWKGTWDAWELCRLNMIVKLVQIPAYVFIFFLGLLCTVMIFTIGITLAFMLLDLFAVGMTGLFATAGFRSLKKEQKITGKMQALYSFASFLFCIDVVIAILGFKLSKPAADFHSE